MGQSESVKDNSESVLDNFAALRIPRNPKNPLQKNWKIGRPKVESDY